MESFKNVYVCFRHIFSCFQHHPLKVESLASVYLSETKSMLLRMSCLEHDLVVRANRTTQNPNVGGGGGGCQQQQPVWGDQVNTPDASFYSLILLLITLFLVPWRLAAYRTSTWKKTTRTATAWMISDLSPGADGP
jgi:hypothetical protein